MSPLTLHRRTLMHHRRSNLAVLLGVIAGAASLTGALLVGESMRGSLRDRALSHLGDVRQVLTGAHFFGQQLASATDLDAQPTILSVGSVTNPKTDARVNRAEVFGLSDTDLLRADLNDRGAAAFAGSHAIINDTLADQLGVKAGDEIVVHVDQRAAISSETLLGRRDAQPAVLRLTVDAIVPAAGFGGFSLQPRQTLPANVFVPLATLQRALDMSDRVNAAFSTRPPDSPVPAIAVLPWTTTLREKGHLSDIGLRIRNSEQLRALVLESDTMLIPPAIERVATAVAASQKSEASPVISYLANEIAIVDEPSADAASPRRAIPYSTVAAIDPASFVFTDLPKSDAAKPISLTSGQILLNAWAAKDLGAKVGDRIRLTYYALGEFGKIETRHVDFTVGGVVPLEAAAADPTLTPEFPGVTDAKRMTDWDPPFPVDLTKVREQDEEYWEQHRATPKAFVTLADGERLWAEADARLGRYTSIRIKPLDPHEDLDAAAHVFEMDLMNALTLDDAGMRLVQVRADALVAATGSTDFGGLFIGFSFFLIVSAAMLVALLFRLGVERRAREIGMLLAVGFAPARIARMLLVEGALIAAIGSAIGLAAAVGYAWLMLAGLRTWWSAAANAPFLTLHASVGSFLLGFVLSFLVAVGSVWWSLRGIVRHSPRALLAGVVEAAGGASVKGRGRVVPIVATVAIVGAFVLIALGVMGTIAQAGAFFGGGSLLLMGALAVVRVVLRQIASTAAESGLGAMPKRNAGMRRLSLRNAARHTGRSMLTVSLIASATFVVASLGAFRIDANTGNYPLNGGAGGYALYAESTTPLVYDLNTAAGRDALNMQPAANQSLSDITVTPFRLRDGDASSCMNLYMPRQPRILGATSRQIDRGGFTFSGRMRIDGQRSDNPWTLLDATLPDGAIPVIGDEAAVMWQLHSGLGKDFVVQGERGQYVKLRFVALLSGSVLQDELIVSEANFKRMFPSIDGYGFFLIQTKPDQIAAVSQTLERNLSPFGFDAAPTADRLRDYLAVQNTYITTFQTLGGLGLVLGCVGLIAVLLRNVWERRRELALMQALGFPQRSLVRLVLVENAALVLTGLVIGAVPALLAVAPALLDRPASIPWSTLGGTLAGVIVIAIGAGWVALVRSLRTPLLPALRSE